MRVDTRAQLEDLEDLGLSKAAATYAIRAIRLRPDAEWLLDDNELRAFHRAAFDGIWTWAGKYRMTETNIGVDPVTIAVEIRDLMENARAWMEYETYPPVEQAIRLHAGIGRVHPFVNGNGRSARLYVETVLVARGIDTQLEWSRDTITNPASRRKAYIEALRLADSDGNFEALVEFAITD